MIIVTVRSKIKPEYTNQYLNEFKKVSIDVRDERGCLEYELYQKNIENSEFFLFERWETREMLDAHLKSTHMNDFIAKTEDWFEAKEIKIYEVK